MKNNDAYMEKVQAAIKEYSKHFNQCSICGEALKIGQCCKEGQKLLSFYETSIVDALVVKMVDYCKRTLLALLN